MKIRFITDCVIGQTEFFAGQIYEEDDAAAQTALQLGRAVPVAEPAAEANGEGGEGEGQVESNGEGAGSETGAEEQ